MPPLRGKVTYRTVQQLAIELVLATGFGALRPWTLFANQRLLGREGIQLTKHGKGILPSTNS